MKLKEEVSKELAERLNDMVEGNCEVDVYESADDLFVDLGIAPEKAEG